MKAIELYKFVTENEIEYHDDDNDIIMFVNFADISDFNKLIGGNATSERGIDCIFKDGYICFYMNNICEYFGIELSEIFKPNN
jgi:hypothetical protein